MTIKRTYLIQDSDGRPVYDDLGELREFPSERAALRFAKEHLKEVTAEEVWIFALSHVISRPNVDPIVDVVA